MNSPASDTPAGIGGPTEKRTSPSEEGFRTLVESAPDIIERFDRDFRILYVNPAHGRVTGIPVSQVVGRRKSEMGLPPEILTLWESKLTEVFAAGQQVSFEFDCPTPAGTVHFDARLLPEFAPDGSVQTVLSVLRDSTREKRAREALQESRDRLALAIEAGKAGLAHYDLKTGKLEWNRRTFEILGHAPDAFEPTYERWRSQVHPDDRSEAEANFDRCVRERRDVIHMHRILRPDGQIAWVRFMGRIDYAPDGSPARCTAIIIDISPFHQMHEQMRQAKEKAEAASHAKDQFFAALSHELRTPLTPAIAAAQMLERDCSLSPAARESAELIRRNVELEARLIDDLLDVNRVAYGKLELHLAPVDLHDLIHHVAAMCRPDIEAKRLRLVLEPRAVSPCVHGDSARLQQVIWNLLKNAVKFTPEGGTVTLGTQNPDAQTLTLAVRDTGVGIDPEVLPRLFCAFEQGGRHVTRTFGGLGLGLAISKGLVELHGGTLVASSPGVGRGAAFTMRLPAMIHAPSAGHDAPCEPTLTAPCRLLLVEDHPDTAKTISRLLRNLGHEVLVADSIASALEAFDNADFDLLVSDIGLPDGTGHELLRQVNARRPIKAIAMSGYGMEQDIRESQEAGFSEHLVKPFGIHRLREAIERICG